MNHCEDSKHVIAIFSDVMYFLKKYELFGAFIDI